MVGRLAVYVDVCSGHVLEGAVGKEACGARWTIAVTGAGRGAFARDAA
jgi:hypothetical protein